MKPVRFWLELEGKPYGLQSPPARKRRRGLAFDGNADRECEGHTLQNLHGNHLFPRF